MAVATVSREDILRMTLFHIQLNRFQYIDNFPEKVADVIQRYVVERGIRDYEKIKRQFYRIDTSFFRINGVAKRTFYEGLFRRIKNLLQRQS